MTNIKSPITYTGSKYKLLDFIRTNKPENIKTFIDLFGGSGVVSLNMKYTGTPNVIYNELSNIVFNTLENLGKGDITKIEEYMNEVFTKRRINKFRDQNQYAKMTPEEKKESTGTFYNFRQYINTYGDKLKETNPLKYYVFLFVYSKSEIFGRLEFKDNKLVGSAGTKPSKQKMMEELKLFQHSWKNITTKNESYEWINDYEFKDNTFIYLDPPYYNTKAHYNKGWTKDSELALLKTLRLLDTKGVKWMMSNAPNKHLYEFAKKYNYNIREEKYHYTLGGGSKESIEIIMTNYELPKEIKQLKLFE